MIAWFSSGSQTMPWCWHTRSGTVSATATSPRKAISCTPRNRAGVRTGSMLRNLCRNVWVVPSLVGLIFGVSMNNALGQDLVGVVTGADQSLVQTIVEGGGWP